LLVQEEGFEKQLFWVVSAVAALLTVIWCTWQGGWNE
jgi:hypothetical protein